MIAKASSWRYVGIVVGAWNFIGLLLLGVCYRDHARPSSSRKKKEILGEVDYIGGLLSTVGVLLFMIGMQWGAQQASTSHGFAPYSHSLTLSPVQYSWDSTHVLVPFILGIAGIISFFVWEMRFAPYPMAPAALFSKDKRTMIATLLLTFWSGGNYFVVLLLWPTQCYDVYGMLTRSPQ